MEMGSLTIIPKNVIHITPFPILARLIGLYDRMSCF